MPEDVSRRQVLRVLGVGAVAVGTGALALSVTGCTSTPDVAASPSGASTARAHPTATAGAAWPQPEIQHSVGGVLDLTLSVGEHEVAVAGTTARMLAYNGTVPGPTLHLRPGDLLRVRLRNDLAEPTNLHTHGLVVSAADNGDNPFLHIGPGETFDYEIALPEDHPPGVCWYHPHHHGRVADQLFAGLYGAIVVDDEDWSAAPPLIAVVSDVTLSGGAVATVAGIERMRGRTGDMLLVNGLSAPALRGRAGSDQRILFVNACASRYLDLRLDPFDARLRGIDSGRRPEQAITRLLLAPGNRADVVITVPAEPTDLVTAAHDRGGAGMGMMGGAVTSPEAVVLAVVPDDAADAGRVAAAAPGIPRDLREVTVDGTRTLTLSMGMGGGAGMRFLIDGREFAPGRVDQLIRLGTVEEWTIVNDSGMAHPFHLHIWPMQLVRVNRRDVAEIDVRDVVDVPAGEAVTVRIAFDRFPGRTVYHCHILDHEDLGMMGVAEAVET